MKHAVFCFAICALVFTLCACKNGEKTDLSHSSNGMSLEERIASIELTTDSSTEYAKVIQGYSLQDIGLTVDTSKTFHDPNRNADGLWGAEHTAVSDYWNSGEFYGNVTRIHVDTSERMVDFTPNNMFISCNVLKRAMQRWNLRPAKGSSPSRRRCPKTCIVEKNGYLICNVTGFFYPDESFEDRIQEQQELFPDYDFEWARSVYDYVSENLLDLIQPEAA